MLSRPRLYDRKPSYNDHNVSPIRVDPYSGYKSNERPREFTLDEQIYEIDAVLDQWFEPSAIYFKVPATSISRTGATDASVKLRRTARLPGRT